MLSIFTHRFSIIGYCTNDVKIIAFDRNLKIIFMVIFKMNFIVQIL
jgi:hypothetical protein